MPRRGVVVSDINVKSQLELLKVRRELERLMARLAAERSTEPDRERFRAIAAGMHDAAGKVDDVAFMRLDRELNLHVAEACRNDYAQRAMTLINGLSRRFWYVHYKQVLDLPLCAKLHAELAQTIASGQQDAAAAASDNLIDYIEEFTRASLEASVDFTASARRLTADKQA